ncbi:hypothetical protein [Pedobacter boryungensis]|uniref:MFS transporter n=1 Tax=Pedobacter boryungensis TaxID=869962 RepID=A0ABX2DEH9_9SPHI|nr:hypothetical protein [Pedobacter boryungensis]NQX31701.1 hypothetical protein [Pedobacter boryungensis]
MEKMNKLPDIEFIKAMFIVNALSLITTLFFAYKYYFANAGKGIDDFLFVLAVLSLPSFFAAIAASKFINHKEVRIWLIGGLICTIFCGTYVYLGVLDNSLLLGLVLITAPLAVCFMGALIFYKNLKIFRTNIYCIFFLSTLIGAGPIVLLFVVGGFAWIWSLFYKG